MQGCIIKRSISFVLRAGYLDPVEEKLCKDVLSKLCRNHENRPMQKGMVNKPIHSAVAMQSQKENRTASGQAVGI